METILSKLDAEIHERKSKYYLTMYTMEVEKAKSLNEGEINGLELAKQIVQSNNLTIVKAAYTRTIDKHDYSKLVCKLDNGEERVYHFHASNPMPKEYVIEGLTWDELLGVCEGMFRMAINEYIMLKPKEKGV